MDAGDFPRETASAPPAGRARPAVGQWEPGVEFTFTELQWSVALHFVLQALTLLRVLAREDRDPAARVAWVLVVVGLPFIGVGLYFLVGEVKISSKTLARMTEAVAHLPTRPGADAEEADEDSEPDPDPEVVARAFRPAFARAAAANGFEVTTGNRCELVAGADPFVDRLLADIAAAQDHVHLLFYIWLPDRNGVRVAQALAEAAARGVNVRVMVDALGSRKFVSSPHWPALAAAGVRTVRAFSISFPLLRLLISRVDIRNHRKIVVIDGRSAWVGSQNCADAEFYIKRRFGPWIDAMVRIEGPVVWQHQQLFISDWITHGGHDISELLEGRAPVPLKGGVPAIALGSGPQLNKHSVSDLFQSVIATARHEVLITTPYYVPNEALHQQICAAAVRGVRVRMILPRRNDSRVVGLASRSYYRQLLSAGVELHEHAPGLLHAKTLVVDGRAVVVGSANMDRRSFELNFENCLLVVDPALAAAVTRQQEIWMAGTREVDQQAVSDWSLPRRMLNNLVATLGPLL